MTAEVARPERGSVARPESVTARTARSFTPADWDLSPQLLVARAAAAMASPDRDLSCGLTLLPAGRAPETAAATDDIPIRVDWLQHTLGQGPSVATDPGQVLVSGDLTRDQRWPEFGRSCAAVMDVRSMVSVLIPLAGVRARLNFYSTTTATADDFDLKAALRLARLAAPAAGRLFGEFGQAIASPGPSESGRLATALGIVMACHRVSSAQAFEILRRAAEAEDRPVLAVALDVVEAGQLPEASRRSLRDRGSGGP